MQALARRGSRADMPNVGQFAFNYVNTSKHAVCWRTAGGALDPETGDDRLFVGMRARRHGRRQPCAVHSLNQDGRRVACALDCYDLIFITIAVVCACWHDEDQLNSYTGDIGNRLGGEIDRRESCNAEVIGRSTAILDTSVYESLMFCSKFLGT